MSQFTKKQMRAGQSDQSFLDWIVDRFLPQHFPEAFNGIDRATLLRMQETGLAYARHFGFFGRAEQTQFLALMNDVGPDFWRFPGFADVMSRTEVPADTRIDQIYAHVTPQEFEAALFGQDSLYWFPKQVENHALGMG